MEAYIQIKKLHSEKKNKDYVTGVIGFGSNEYFINIPNDAIYIALNITPRQFADLQVGYCSPKLKLEVVD